MSTTWIEVPAGRFRVGLEPDEARRLAQASAAAFEARPTDSVGESLERERTAGNADWVEQLLLDLYPAHDVDLNAFAIAAEPVTNAEYRRFMDETQIPAPRGWRRPHNAEPGRAVLGVSWQQAQAFASWAGARLPTEAQWERAARGEARRLFPWGDDYGLPGELLDQQDVAHSWEPGAYPSLATDTGIFDLVTRRWEWCADPFAPYPGGNDARWREYHRNVEPEWRARRGGEPRDHIASAISRLGGIPDGAANTDTRIRLVRA